MKKNSLATQVTDTVILDENYPQVRAATLRFITELAQESSTKNLKLPSLPEIALRIRNALADDAYSPEKIAHLVGSEPALAARLLQAANCALFYRGNQPISNLRTAITRLGDRMVRNVSISLAAQQVFIGYTVRELKPYLEDIWKHSISVAAIAYQLAKHNAAVDPDDAFLAGLVHKIGMSYILMRAKDHPQLFKCEPAFQNVITEWAPDIGRTITEAWGFSDQLIDAVGNHQSCDLGSIDPSCLTAIVAVADILTNTLQSRPINEDLFEDLPDFGHLGLDTATLATVIYLSEEETRALHQTFLA